MNFQTFLGALASLWKESAVRKTFLFIIAVYFVWFIVMQLVLQHYADDNSDYYISLLASFVEDAIFFGTLGIATIIVSVILSLRNPEDAEFNTRIKALVNNTSVKPDSAGEIHNEIRDLLVLTEKHELKLTIEKIVEQKIDIRIDGKTETINQKFMKLHVEVVHHYVNLCRDESFKPSNYKLFVEPCSVPVEGKFGTLTHVDVGNGWQTSARDLPSSEKMEILDSLVIPAAKRTTRGAKYWTWCGIANSPNDDTNDNIFYNYFRYYSESSTLTIINNTSHNLKLYSRVKDFDAKEILVRRGRMAVSAGNIGEYDELPVKNANDPQAGPVTLYEQVAFKKGSRIHLRFML